MKLVIENIRLIVVEERKLVFKGIRKIIIYG